MEIYKETTPLSERDCFRIFSRYKSTFDFPLHYHDEYELNLIFNAKGAQRVVGNHIGTIDDVELVLIGPGLIHYWNDGECTSDSIHEVTIQFTSNMFGDQFIQKTQMRTIKEMLKESSRGIKFSRSVTNQVMPRIMSLYNEDSFKSLLNFMQILYDLSLSSDYQLLSAAFKEDELKSNSRRIDRVLAYMNDNYSKPIRLEDVAKIANMTDVSFSRFIKQRTGTNFIDFLNEIRIGHVTRQLIDTDIPVTQIAYDCGFNNIANFNRVFRKRKGLTPKEFRTIYKNQTAYV